jgi:hypothetical protein
MTETDQYGSGGSFDGPVEARYVSSPISEYEGNPYIECLPPIMSRDAAIKAMQKLITVSAKQCAQPIEIRLHMIGAIEQFVQPLNLHVDLHSRMSVLLRWGYVQRNPLKKGFLEKLLAIPELTMEDAAGARSFEDDRGKGSGITILGQSGVGKTTSVFSVLRTFPQVVRHTHLKGVLRSVDQLVWLVLSCPAKGSILAMCTEFFRRVDKLLGTQYLTLYAKRGVTGEAMAASMATVAYIHGLGMLVIDELQNLREANSGESRATMMNFFKLLRDVMKVPIVTVGTMQASGLVGGNSQMARRHADFPVFERMKPGDEFEFFCQSLFDAQYLPRRVDLDETNQETGAWLSLLYDLSQGVTALVVKLFIIGQHRAISDGAEILTQDHIQSVYDSCFRLLHPYLERMRKNMPVDEGDFDISLKSHSLENLVSASDATPQPPMAANSDHKAPTAVRAPEVQTADANDETTPAPAAAVTGVEKKRKPRRKKGEVSPVGLIAIVEAGAGTKASAHTLLTEAGLIRNIGEELLGE